MGWAPREACKSRACCEMAFRSETRSEHAEQDSQMLFLLNTMAAPKLWQDPSNSSQVILPLSPIPL